MLHSPYRIKRLFDFYGDSFGEIYCSYDGTIKKPKDYHNKRFQYTRIQRKKKGHRIK